MTGIERVDPGFKLLAVAARMHGVADIVVPENGQACNGVADAIVGLTQGLLAKKTIGGRDKGVEAYIGDFTHPAKPHIAAPRDHASRQDAVISFPFCVAAQNMLEGVHESALPVHKM